MKRALAYGRTSTKIQNVDLQLREIQSYADNRGWVVKKTIFDQSTGTNLKRPGFQEILKLCRSREADIVIVWKLDRAFRSLRDCINTLQEFNELGVELVSLKDNLDMTTSTGRLMIHIIAAFAAFEADIIKERVIAGLENARAKGKTLGRPAKLNTSEVVSLRAHGMSLSQIATKLGTTKSAVSKSLSKSKQNLAINITPIVYKDPSSKVE